MRAHVRQLVGPAGAVPPPVAAPRARHAGASAAQARAALGRVRVRVLSERVRARRVRGERGARRLVRAVRAVRLAVAPPISAGQRVRVREVNVSHAVQ